jgi:hypothetical protein
VNTKTVCVIEATNTKCECQFDERYISACKHAGETRIMKLPYEFYEARLKAIDVDRPQSGRVKIGEDVLIYNKSLFNVYPVFMAFITEGLLL